MCALGWLTNSAPVILELLGHSVCKHIASLLPGESCGGMVLVLGGKRLRLLIRILVGWCIHRLSHIGGWKVAYILRLLVPQAQLYFTVAWRRTVAVPLHRVKGHGGGIIGLRVDITH